MTLYGIAEEADDFLREFTRRGRKYLIAGLVITRPALELTKELLSLAGRRPKWKQTPLAPSVGAPYYSRAQQRLLNSGVSLQVLAPEVLEARGDLVSCGVLLAVARYDARPRGRCPERLRALASVVLVEEHAILTSPKVP